MRARRRRTRHACARRAAATNVSTSADSHRRARPPRRWRPAFHRRRKAPHRHAAPAFFGRRIELPVFEEVAQRAVGHVVRGQREQVDVQPRLALGQCDRRSRNKLCRRQLSTLHQQIGCFGHSVLLTDPASSDRPHSASGSAAGASSFSCATLVADAIGAVTLGRAISQASADLRRRRACAPRRPCPAPPGSQDRAPSAAPSSARRARSS